MKDSITFSALLKSGEIYSSSERGIKPMLEKLKEDPDFFEGAIIMDKVMGRAAALLAAFARAEAVFVGIVSEPALEIFSACDIPCQYRKRVDRIENRTKTGLCPMETLTLSVSDPEQAFELLKNA